MSHCAAAVASAPVLTRLDVLAMSTGTLGDAGATVLLTGQPLTHLKKLDLRHNHIREPIPQRLRDTLDIAGVELDLDQHGADTSEGHDGTRRRYVAVGV
jgi:hypothetical protein